MSIFLAELIGTALLILLGNGVVANVVLKETKGHDSGWIVITLGWAMAVFVAVYSVGQFSGAHINPAVTIALALLGKTAMSEVPFYIAGQLGGAIIGACLVYFSYKQHYDATEDELTKRHTFSTTPAIRNSQYNLLTEIIATFVLVLGVLFIVGPEVSLGALDALPVALLVLAIGLSLGGPTGYAINPARDLGPRIAHAFLPLKNKAGNDWEYAWIPVVGPIVGGVLAAGVFMFLGL